MESTVIITKTRKNNTGKTLNRLCFRAALGDLLAGKNRFDYTKNQVKNENNGK